MRIYVEGTHVNRGLLKGDLLFLGTTTTSQRHSWMDEIKPYTLTYTQRPIKLTKLNGSKLN